MVQHSVLHMKLRKGTDGDSHHTKLKPSFWLSKTPPTYPTLYFHCFPTKTVFSDPPSPKLTFPTHMSKLYTKSDQTNPMFGLMFKIRIFHIKSQTYGSSGKMWKQAIGYHSPQGYHKATSGRRKGATVLSDGRAGHMPLHTRSTLLIYITSLSWFVTLDSQHIYSRFICTTIQPSSLSYSSKRSICPARNHHIFYSLCFHHKYLWLDFLSGPFISKNHLLLTSWIITHKRQ